MARRSVRPPPADPRRRPGALPLATDRPDSAGLLIARIAGLPATWLEAFGEGEHLRVLKGWDEAERDLDAARAALGQRLYETAASAPPLLRRFLLAVKRDCHNGRSLLRRRSAPEWEELRMRMGPLMDQVVTLEERAQALWEDFERAFQEKLESEARHLQSLTEHKGLRRGLALASGTLASQLPRLAATPPSAWGRKENRAALSLLRYGSRAAFKLSPYSTLTRLALGRMVEDQTSPALHLLSSPDAAGERSLVRLRRYLLHQLATVLLQRPALRDSLAVGLNPSIQEIEPDRYRLLSTAVREAPLSRSVLEWLQDQTKERVSLEELRAALSSVIEPERVPGLLGRLLKLGILLPLPPWPVHDPRLEERIAHSLGELPAVAGLLERIVEIEEGFADTPDPAGALREIRERFEEAWSLALAAAGLPPGTSLRRHKEEEVYEDVLLLGSQDAPPELIEVSAPRLRDVVESIEPWFRLVDLFSPRDEMLLTFAALARQRWPGRDEVGALELFQEIRPYWKEIRSLLAAPPPPDAAGPGFDPLQLPEIADLRRMRQTIWREIPGLLREDGDALRLSSTDLRNLASSLPTHLNPAVGPCLFLQPADASGELWMLNRIFEGTGRYGSRFTPVLPDDLRRRYIGPLLTASTLRREGEDIELLDLLSSQGDTVNLHAVQTRSVLTLPGEPLDPEPGRKVDISDLRVRLDGPLPSLAGRDGQRFLPVHLGGAALVFTPPPITFLALFGPGELRPIPAPRTARQEEDVKVLPRVVLDRVVLARRRWIVPTAPLADLFTLPPARAFAALDRWRRARYIPERVFAIERVYFEKVTAEVYKPQFLDLTSPSFCALLQAVLRTSGPSLVLEEMLPTPDAYPRDAAGTPWAAELLVDTLAGL